jgi:hypothetical protein
MPRSRRTSAHTRQRTPDSIEVQTSCGVWVCSSQRAIAARSASCLSKPHSGGTMAKGARADVRERDEGIDPPGELTVERTQLFASLAGDPILLE